MSPKLFAIIALIALSLSACAGPAPSPTPTPVPPTASATPTASLSPLPAATALPTVTSVPTETALHTRTATNTPLPTATVLPSSTVNPSGRVEGRVVGSDGKPIAGMRLSLVNWQTLATPGDTTTDNNGYYVFEAVPPGGYVLGWVVTRPNAPILFDGTNPFGVSPGVTSTMNIVMH